jgi:hypothetical protein
MTVFLGLMAAGLTGLVVMALPAFGQHAHFGTPHGLGSAGQTGLHIGPAHGAAHVDGTAGQALTPQGHPLTPQGSAQGTSGGGNSLSLVRFLPSPRMIFSLLALYGAFGNLFHSGLHMQMMIAALLAAVPAVLLEKFVVTPLWNAMIASQGKPCSPLEALTLCEAEAVTPFRNGKGIVAVERDGRLVQFSAQLLSGQTHLPVQVGDKLRVEEVDPARERMTVSVL